MDYIERLKDLEIYIHYRLTRYYLMAKLSHSKYKHGEYIASFKDFCDPKLQKCGHYVSEHGIEYWRTRYTPEYQKYLK